MVEVLDSVAAVFGSLSAVAITAFGVHEGKKFMRWQRSVHDRIAALEAEVTALRAGAVNKTTNADPADSGSTVSQAVAAPVHAA